MKINILLPYKEKFDELNASSVSITVKNNLKYSTFKNNIKVFGRLVDNPISENFIGIKPSKFFFKSKNLYLAKHMISVIEDNKKEKQIIEIHNRPYVFHYVAKKIKDCALTIFFHNDPLTMKGSKTIAERISIINKASAVYCVSNFIKNKFEQDLNYITDKIYVLNNGVDRTLVNFPKKQKSVLFVGRLVREKGVHLFVDAVKKLAPKFHNWKFFICGSPVLGDDKKKSNFGSLVTKKFLNIGEQAIFTGFLSNKNINEMMQEASIIVVPSLWEEPFGLVVAEAMSNGCAIITVDKGGIPEIIDKNGLIIKNITTEKLIQKLQILMNDSKTLKNFQNLSWNNFKHSSISSSKKLDDIRNKILES